MPIMNYTLTIKQMTRNLIAILRGIKPHEVVDIANVIVKAGINMVEVPLNSPSAFESIDLLINEFSMPVQIGAGTVTNLSQVETLVELGVDFIVSPNCDPAVIMATKEANILSYPGVVTPSECFTAISCGADYLKFFPASLIGQENLSSIMAVLPNTISVYMVGGVSPRNFKLWLEAGATGFGLGSVIYKPGDSPSLVAQKSELIVSSYDQATNKI